MTVDKRRFEQALAPLHEQSLVEFSGRSSSPQKKRDNLWKTGRKPTRLSDDSHSNRLGLWTPHAGTTLQIFALLPW